MGTAEKKLKATVEDYFAYEASMEGKSEFYDGEIFDMAGGTRVHNELVGNLVTAFNVALKGNPCKVYPSDQKLQLAASNAYVYPDVQVVCDPRIDLGQRDDVVNKSVLVVEVLSPTTAAFDRGGKLRRYMALSTLREIVLVEQSLAQVDVFYRPNVGEDWRFRSYFEMTDKVFLESLGINLEMEDIYAKIEFPEDVPVKE
jgi:Uma2 family endonuclease